jgi:hypothetical protein
VRRLYDRAQTPLERLIALGALGPTQRTALEALRTRTDPFELSERIDRKLGAIRKAALEQLPQPPLYHQGGQIATTTAHRRRLHAARVAVAPASGNIRPGATIRAPVTS